jgi:tight adherence protein B
MFFLVLTITLLVALTVCFFILAISKFASKEEDTEKFHQMIDAITRSEIELERQESDLPPKNTWTGYWYSLALAAGFKPDNKAAPGYTAIIVPIVAFATGYLVWPGDLVGGIVGMGLTLLAIRGYLKFTAGRRLAILDKQLPNLLSGLRASLQANLTPQQALLAQADEINAPLGDELRILRNELSVNIPLDTALNNLAVRIPSREVKFLVAAIRIAISSGTDLDPLVETIQKIVVQRARIAAHLSTAVAQVQPAIAVTGVMIPAGLAFSYYSSETNQAFWQTPIGLIALIVVGVLYSAGLFIAKKQVDRVKNS